MPQAKQSESDWITKDEAAELLGVNPRQVQKRVEQGYIEKRTLARLPTEPQGRVQYSRADVDALLAGAPNQHAVEVPANGGTKDVVRMPNGGAPLSQSIAEMAGFTNGLMTVREFLNENKPEHPDPWLRYKEKLWLTLDESVAYSGLPRPEMERLLREGLVYSFGRGPKTWRVQRAALDSYGTAAHQ